MTRFYDLVLLFAVGWHLAGLSGVADALPSVWFLVALGVAGVSFLSALALHPARTWRTEDETMAHLSWRDATTGMKRSQVWMAGAFIAYGAIVGVVALIVAKLRHGGGPVDTQGLGPVGNSAFTLVFAAIGWLTGRSGAALKARMKAAGTWFR